MNSKNYRLFLTLILLLATPQDVKAEKCLFVSSYHQGYDWADGIEDGVRQILIGQCEFKQINMDTKRNKSEEYKTAKALEVKDFIDQWKPDVVVVADDNASKYLVKPYFRNSDLPFVFCGINWTVAEYGYPYENATGMIEVAPIQQMYELIKSVKPQATVAYYVAADTLTEEKSFYRYQRAAKKYNIRLVNKLSKSLLEWQQAFQEGQDADFIILGTKSGINDWDDELAYAKVKETGRVLSLTAYEWMVQYTILGMTKVPQEQGIWAAKVALEILAGAQPRSIPIIPNQQWDMLINASLLQSSHVTLPESFLIKSKKVYVTE
ncbi:hypothetical protein MNBD_GAMMA16-1259 [hydrothermal vent metagenome]|uniref:ABC transporter substrate-binding protein n=1 Tax=hydrothermal vent metagenome TaxID=652676 RepID=A0A3B0Z3E7_9ZZZZ